MTPLNLDPNVNYLAQPREVDIPEWRKGLAAFGSETAALGSGLKALVAQALNMPDVRDQALADYQQNVEEATAGWKAPEVGQIEDIELTEPGGLGRLGSYLGYQVPKGIAQLGALVAGGGLTGGLAKATASTGIKELAKAEMKNVALGMAQKAVATPLVERVAGREAIKQLATRQLKGAAAGVAAGGFGMETGQTYGQLATEPDIGPEKAVLPALAYGGVAGILEYLPIHAGAKAIGLDRMLLRKTIKESPELAAEAVKLSLRQKALRQAAKVGNTALLGGLAEGVTEGLQGLAQLAAERYAKEDPTWANIVPQTPDEWSSVWNQVAAAAATGATAGAALGPFVQPRGRVREQAEEAAGEGAGAGVAEPPVQQGEPAPEEAPAAPPSIAGAEVTPDVVPRDQETYPAVTGEPPIPAAAEAATSTGEQPPGVTPGGEVQAQVEGDILGGAHNDIPFHGPDVAETARARLGVQGEVVPVEGGWAIRPQGGEVVKTTTTPQSAQPPLEVTDAQQVAGAGTVYEDVPRPEEQGGQEVQVPAAEGGDRVLQGGQEEVPVEVIRKSDGKTFASRASATKKLNQLWEQGKLKTQEGPEAGRQARARIAKQGDGYVIERLESFGGQRSGQIKPPTVAQAEHLEALGKSPQDIRRATGLHRGMEGKWRFEVSNENAKLLPTFGALEESEPFTAGTPTTLGAILANPELFVAYPAARDIKVVKRRAVLDSFGSTQGWYDGDNTITISPTAKNPLSTLLHEVQHWIQNYEGFAPGGNQNVVWIALSDAEKRRIAEEAVREAKKKADTLGEQLAEVNRLSKLPELAEYLAAEARYQELQKVARDDRTEAAYRAANMAHWNWLQAAFGKRLSELTSTQQQAVIVAQQGSRQAELLAATWQRAQEDYANIQSGSEKALKNYLRQSGKAFDLYQRIAGEIEARDVQARQELTATERRNIDPDIREDAIVLPRGRMERLESREAAKQEGPDVLESRTLTPSQSTTDFVAATDSVLGQGWTQRAINAGILEVNETSPADSASGYYEPATGKFVVNLDRVPQGQSPIGVLLHEGSHAGMERMLGTQFQAFHSDLQKLANQGSETARLAVLQATQGAITAINRQRERIGLEVFPHRLGDETLPKSERGAELQRVRQLIAEQNPGLLPEEDLAYYIQLASARPPTEAGFWKRLLSAIQAWAAQTPFGKALVGLGWRPELSPQLAVELAKQAAQATLRRAELVNRLVGERSKVLRALPASAQLGLMESAVWHAGPTTWAPEPGFPRGRPRLDKVGTGEGVLDRIGQQHLDWQTGERLESRQSDISANWWRSGVLDTISSAKQQKATPDQWLGWLKNQAGVKPEEIDDLGLEDWLAAQEGTVTKAKVEQFVRDGGVRIEEVLKGTPADTQRIEEINARRDAIDTEMEKLRYDFQGSGYLLRDIRTGHVKAEELAPEFQAMSKRYDELRKENGDLEVELQDVTELRGQPPKFGSYQTPGGKNYRELLITVPTQKEASDRLDAFTKRMEAKYGEQWSYKVNPEEQAEWQNASVQVGQEVGGTFISPHWSEPNVLVHIRFNERTDAEGKRVLFVEEVQSDWHQEGRKKGYNPEHIDTTGWKAIDDTPSAPSENPHRYYVVTATGDRAGKEVHYIATSPEDAISQAAQSQKEIQEGVPNAPLKSAWPLLGMKRAIRWAAEHGFDKVAWTQGDVQAERYDLSKQVERIAYAKNGNGTYELEAVDKNGNVIINREEATRSEIENIVGKEIADKIDAGAGITPAQYAERYSQPLDDIFTGVLEGVDLKVGGEGMRGFYDKMLPSMLNKYGKKFGARVGMAEIIGGTPTTEPQAIVRQDGPNVWRVYQEFENWRFSSREDAEAFAKELNGGERHSQLVWSLPITPALREEALAGQLLYSIPPLNSWSELSTWFTSPVSTYPEDFNKPGEFNKVAHALVDRFHYVQEKSPGLYRALDEWKNRQGALQKEVERIYEVPLRQLVSRYKIEDSDVEPIRRTEIAHGTATPETQYTKVEVLGHQLAARHILEDNVTEQLALRAAPEFLKELKKQLSPRNVGLLNADIKAATQGSTAIKNLSNTEARRLFLNYLPSANPQSDIGARWALYNRRSAGYSIATPGSTEALEDAVAGFINAREIYTQQIANRELFQQITDLTDQLASHQLKMLQEGGLLTQTEVDNLSQAYPHYVPLRREAFDYGLELKSIFEKPRQSIGKLMTRDGSIETPSAVHVLQNHLASGFMAASAAARNQMMNKFYDVVNADRQGWQPWFYFSDKRRNNGAMGLIRNGKTLYIVPADGNLRAASITKVIVGQDAQELSGPLKLMRAINNWIRWSNVSASPAFLLANAPRDYLTSRYNLLASDAAAYAKEIGSWSSYKESFKALHKVLVQGVRESADPQEQAWIELVEDFEKAGGKTSFVEALRAMDGESWKSFEAQVGRREGKQRAVVEWGRDKLEWIENLNEAFENVMRLSTYKVMRNKVGKERAAEIARNLTTNFTRRGAHIDTINTWWLFYNATVQGNWQVIQNMFLNPNKAGQRRLQKAVVGTIVFAFLVDQLGRALSDDEDKDGISDWDSRTSWDKERKISSPFQVGGVYPSIPAPWVFNVFWRLGGMLSEVKDGVLKPQDAVLDSIGLTLTTMNPISGGTPAQLLAPSSFDPFMQIIENKDFMGNPLGPDGYPGASKRPDAYLAWDSTPEGYKWLARFVNEVTGGSPVESGRVDLRPSSLNVLTDFALGGLGRSVVELGRLGLSPVVEGLDFEGPEKVPGAKVFLSAPSDSTAISLYHDRVAQVLGAKHLIKLYSEGNERNPQKLADVQQARAAVLRMVPQVEDTERQIKALRKSLRSAQARNDSRTEEQLRERIVTLQKRFNQSFSRRVGN